MKKRLLPLLLLVGTLAATNVLFVAAPVMLTGCAHLQTNADQVVVRSEQLAAGAFELMDALVEMEINNRDSLRKLNPNIERVANRIRTEGRKGLEELRTATKIYKAHRTPENKANVETWIATIENLKRIAREYLVSSKPIVP